MTSKTVSETQVEIVQVMFPEHANPAGNVHGGHILKMVDQAAAIVASRHARTNVVTASLDRMDFFSPVFIGNVVFSKASLNYVARTSMEIGVRVEAECLKSGIHTHVGSAYLTFVALDPDGKPTEVPRLIPKSEEEKRRFEEGKKRKEIRMRMIKKHDPNETMHIKRSERV